MTTKSSESNALGKREAAGSRLRRSVATAKRIKTVEVPTVRHRKPKGRDGVLPPSRSAAQAFGWQGGTQDVTLKGGLQPTVGGWPELWSSDEPCLT